MNLHLLSSRRLFTLAVTLLFVFGFAACDAAGPAHADLGSATDSGAVTDLTDADDAATDDLVAYILASAAGMGTHTSLGDDDECQGTLGAVTVENVIVPDDATCVLEGTHVQGNVEVKTDALLLARGATVGGNIQASEAEAVTVLRSTVGGNVQLFQGYRGSVARSEVDGDVQVEQNNGFFSLTRNVVDANMQVNQNTGGVSIKRNVIAENLQCNQNTPPPTGSGNQAGDKEDQCENL